MPNQATIQTKIYKGYASAALRLGASFNFYRAAPAQYQLTEGGQRILLEDGSGYLETEPTNRILTEDGQVELGENGQPLSAENVPEWGAFPVGGSPYGSQLVALNAEDMKFSKPNKYAKPTWYALFDATNAAVGDYLIGPSGTFFIAAMQPLLPILVVECNRTIDVVRSTSGSTPGVSGYGGRTSPTDKVLMQQWPCSILQGTKGEKDDVNLPSDTRQPWFAVLLPFYKGTVLKTSDQIVDDLGRRLTVSSVELTDLGYRLTCQQSAP